MTYIQHNDAPRMRVIYQLLYAAYYLKIFTVEKYNPPFPEEAVRALADRLPP